MVAANLANDAVEARIHVQINPDPRPILFIATPLILYDDVRREDRDHTILHMLTLATNEDSSERDLNILQFVLAQ